ncbi:MAG TPA: glycosyltransferase family 39 protein [Terriglobales bacterium]|nr:glycosyltransferase family 39 protein [Terriglobales bacterium]
MLTGAQNHFSDWRHWDRAIGLLLMLLAFAVRIDRIGFNSLSEDEVAKWEAIQEYRHGHFIGVNSEHPMVPKMLAWASLTVGEKWGRLGSRMGWPSMNPEGWLRLPYVLFGSATAAVLFLLCRQMMGIAGSFAAAFFWAVAPLAVSINRLAKEETPLTFFTLLACYFYCRAKQADGLSTRRWFNLSAIGFGFAFASQYIVHLFGMNQLVWHLAGRAGLDHKPLGSGYKRFFLLIFLTFLLVNPVFFSPANFKEIVHWLHHDSIHHIGYAFDGNLYVNLPGRLLSGVPWYFYLWLLAVKTPIPILLAIVVGGILLLRDRQTLASCFFLGFGVLQLFALSISGAKWIRYSLSMLPFLFLAAGYAVEKIWQYARRREVPALAAGMAGIILFAWPLIETRAWAPYYPFYLNSIGGGTKNIARYFAPDEVSEFDTREVAQTVCPMAPRGARLATARPMSMSYYVESCGRADIQVVPLYDRSYAPQQGDLIVLEPSRRFLETQRYFDFLTRSGMANQQIHVGPVLASTIYFFQDSGNLPSDTGQELLTVRSRKPESSAYRNLHKPDWAGVLTAYFWHPLVRQQQ